MNRDLREYFSVFLKSCSPAIIKIKIELNFQRFEFCNLLQHVHERTQKYLHAFHTHISML